MSSPVDTSTAKSYMDFSGLGELRGKAAQNQDKALKETAQQFEGMFIQMMMKSMREANNGFKDEENESSARETFEGMFDKEVSVQLAKKNSMGLADMLVKNLEQQQANIATTAEILKQRQDPAALAAKPIPLNPAQMGIALDKLNPKQNGFALPKPQIFPLSLPNKSSNGGGT